MSVNVTVQTGELTNAASTIGKRVTDLENVVTALKAQVNTLNACWDGDAHEAFKQAITDDIGRISKFINEAKDYQRDLTTIASAYEAAERENTNKLRTRSFK